MRDPISGTTDLVCFGLWLAFALSLAIAPRKILGFLFPRAMPLGGNTYLAFRLIAAVNVLGLLGAFVFHFL